MTSSDERREVAARLRERERGWRKMGTHVSVMPDMPATQFEDIAALLGFNGGWILNADIFARLADLIDPTCEVVGTTSEEGLYGQTIFHHEMSCGHTCDTVWPEPPNHCDECGARVVSHD